MHSLSGPEIKGVCMCVEVLLRAQLRFKAALYSKQTTHLCFPEDTLNGLLKWRRYSSKNVLAIQAKKFHFRINEACN